MEWWQTFFDEQYLKLYQPFFPEERTEREVKFVLDVLALPQGAKVLDLCCGQGRHAVRLAQAGLRVTGFDLSPHLLDVSRHEGEVASVELRLVAGDMREIPFQGEFDAIVNLFTAFGYFEDAENTRVLEGVARALVPSGQFLIDVPNIYHVNASQTWRFWYESDVGPVFQDRTFDPWTGRDTTVFYWFEGGERKSRSFNLRVYTSYEMVAMLRAVGLTLVRLYGGFDLSEYHCRDSRRLIVLARK